MGRDGDGKRHREGDDEVGEIQDGKGDDEVGG